MADFKIHLQLSELVKCLGISEKLCEGALCDDYVESLEKSRTPYINNKVKSISLVKRMAEFSPCSDEVFQKYDELKLKQIREVDPMVHLLSQIQNDEKVKKLLKINTPVTVIESNGLDKNCEAINHLSSPSFKRKEPKRNARQDLEISPSWFHERPHLSWNFVSQPRSDFKHSGPIGTLPVNVQESRLIDDILFCLVGVEGDYIRLQKGLSSENKVSFYLDESINVSLKQLVNNILPLCCHYSTIINFVEENMEYEAGLVNHALAAAMHAFLKDHLVFVSQLENQHLQDELTLQKLWFYIQSSMDTMETIAKIASILTKGNCFGGNVLTALHEHTASLIGSTKSQEICHTLTRAASCPYFEILDKWIYKGIISDPYSEFLVEDNELIKKEDLPVEYSDAYWEKRYTIRRELIPVFLEKCADMILRTGKYLNVIRQCGKTINYPNAKPITYSVRASQYVECIEPAYHFASKKLLDLLMDDADLKGRLLSVKHYFLLDQGDFIVQFMDMAEEELQKDIDDVMPTRLDSLLELALRTSVVNEDKYKDDVRVELLPHDLLTQMFKILQIPPDKENDGDMSENMVLSGLQAFAFAYEVKWPLSLVINGKALTCYQMLFRHLFYCKHIERLLGQVWTLNKRAKSLPSSESCFYTSAFALRQRMLNFIQNLDYYLTLEVIEPHWIDFFKRISQVTNVDEVLICHNDFLDKCLNDCMLTNPKLLHILGTLMRLCVEFSEFFETATRSDEAYTSIGDSMLISFGEQTLPEMSSFPASLENFRQQVEHFGENFDKAIVCMLKILHDVNQTKHTSKIINMLYRLDLSPFYDELSVKFENQSTVSE
ncbi:gamma-tubulin complex component 2-like [Uloborus diversus]|uniref:gamma-tubulin complex component 2-like n=1 Tax=Uloborus diversus TaxID=327109 RepID=UPI0024096F32|nr:gamma-tubulin complex component 2-like [Uloborus diversus]